MNFSINIFVMDWGKLPFNRAQRESVKHATTKNFSTFTFGSTLILNVTGTLIFVSAAFPPLDNQLAYTDPMVNEVGPREPYKIKPIFSLLGKSYGTTSLYHL